MYCIVKYSEVDKKAEAEAVKEKEKALKPADESKSSVERSYSQKSDEKTDVKYEDEVKDLLINPNCLTRILLDYVCEQLSIEKNSEIDFCDEFGRLAKIGDLKNWEYATEALKPQSTYVVISFQSIKQLVAQEEKALEQFDHNIKRHWFSEEERSSSKSFGRTRGSRASLRSSDKYRFGSEHSKTSELRKGMHKGSEASSVQFGKKSSSRNTLRSMTKSAQAALGMESEVEIKTKASKTALSKESKAGLSPKEKGSPKSSRQGKKK